MRMVQFTDEEKIEAFDDIAVRYFYKNFGTMTKTDYIYDAADTDSPRR